MVKASGLAAGKGVLMPQSMAEAKEAVQEVMATRMESKAVGGYIYNIRYSLSSNYIVNDDICDTNGQLIDRE